jgi:hypothetical protein
MLEYADEGGPAMTLTDPLKDAMNLANRFQQGELFRKYVVERVWLVVPAALLMLATSLALAFGIVMFVGGTRPLMVLLSLLLAPLVLVGSLFVQGYVFLSWLEGRALAKSLGRRAKKARGRVAALVQKHFDADLGTAPPVPWLLAGILVGLPLFFLLMAAPMLAIAVIVLHALAPVGFARLDR